MMEKKVKNYDDRKRKKFGKMEEKEKKGGEKIQ